MYIRTMSCKLSDILATIQKNKDIYYLCHAAEHLYCQQTGTTDHEGITADSTHTHHELRRLMPSYIRNEDSDTTLTGWTQNMPSHLRPTLCMSLRTYRIKFLRWAIKKFGDQYVTFRIQSS